MHIPTRVRVGKTKPRSKARGIWVAAREATQHAAMAKLADALRLGRSGRKPMVVQVHLAAHGAHHRTAYRFYAKGIGQQRTKLYQIHR